MRVPALSLAAVLLVACTDPAGISSPAPRSPSFPYRDKIVRVPDAAQTIGRYALARVNNLSLPTDPPTGAGQWDYGGAVVRLAAATLTLRSDGTYSMLWLHSSLLSGFTTYTAMEECGTFVRTGDMIQFDGTDGSSGEFTPGGLTWQWADHSFLAFDP